jgi:hypothetical protein
MHTHTSLDRRAVLVQKVQGSLPTLAFRLNTTIRMQTGAVATNIERARSAFAGLGWRKAETFMHVREITDSG